MLASNTAGGTNTINVPAGNYSLTLTPSGPDDGTTGDLHITADVTIAGAGAGATTISGNTGGGAPNNCTVDPSGSLSPQGHNVELGTSCGFDINADPLVASLANNGGPTQTMALAANSPARDAAAPSFCPSTDQRGVARPDDPGTACDIGAYEFGTSQTVSPPRPQIVPPRTLRPPHNTRITRAKINQKKRTATFRFTAAGNPRGFQCGLVKLRKHHKKPKVRFSRCAAPKLYRHLAPGTYIFEVRALNSAGHDPHPAIRKFTINRRRR